MYRVGYGGFHLRPKEQIRIIQLNGNGEGKGKEKNPGKEIDHMKCCFLGSESSIV